MEALKEAIEKISEYLRFPVWKIGAFIGILFLSFLLRKIFALSVVKTIILIARRTKPKIDDILVKAISGPASSVFILIGIWLGIKVLGIDGDFLKKILWTFGLFLLGWALYNIVKEFEPYVEDFSKRFGEEFAHEIGNFIVKFLRIFIVIVILLSILEKWGINVSAIIASLGIGGLAVALAAKDTFSNMISGLIILLDKPFSRDNSKPKPYKL
jgi:MscS family membrane protein